MIVCLVTTVQKVHQHSKHALLVNTAQCRTKIVPKYVQQDLTAQVALQQIIAHLLVTIMSRMKLVQIYMLVEMALHALVVLLVLMMYHVWPILMLLQVKVYVQVVLLVPIAQLVQLNSKHVHKAIIVIILLHSQLNVLKVLMELLKILIL